MLLLEISSLPRDLNLSSSVTSSRDQKSVRFILIPKSFLRAFFFCFIDLAQFYPVFKAVCIEWCNHHRQRDNLTLVICEISKNYLQE